MSKRIMGKVKVIRLFGYIIRIGLVMEKEEKGIKEIIDCKE